MGATIAVAGAMLILLRKYRADVISTRDGFLMVTLSWVMASAIGAMPFYLSGAIPSYTDAFFETISGFSDHRRFHPHRH